MKLYQWYDTLIVAKDEIDVRKLMKEVHGIDGRSMRRYPIKQVRRKVELVSTSDHDDRAMYKPKEVVSQHGRGVIPTLY